MRRPNSQTNDHKPNRRLAYLFQQHTAIPFLTTQIRGAISRTPASFHPEDIERSPLLKLVPDCRALNNYKRFDI